MTALEAISCAVLARQLALLHRRIARSSSSCGSKRTSAARASARAARYMALFCPSLPRTSPVASAVSTGASAAGARSVRTPRRLRAALEVASADPLVAAACGTSGRRAAPPRTRRRRRRQQHRRSPRAGVAAEASRRRRRRRRRRRGGGFDGRGRGARERRRRDLARCAMWSRARPSAQRGARPAAPSSRPALDSDGAVKRNSLERAAVHWRLDGRAGTGSSRRSGRDEDRRARAPRPRRRRSPFSCLGSARRLRRRSRGQRCAKQPQPRASQALEPAGCRALVSRRAAAEQLASSSSSRRRIARSRRNQARRGGKPPRDRRAVQAPRGGIAASFRNSEDARAAQRRAGERRVSRRSAG